MSKVVLLALALFVPWTGRATGIRVRFAPPEGASAVKSFETRAELTLDEMTVSVGREEARHPYTHIALTSSQRAVVADTYLAPGDGRPEKLARRFDELESEFEVEMELADQREGEGELLKREFGRPHLPLVWRQAQAHRAPSRNGLRPRTAPQALYEAG